MISHERLLINFVINLMRFFISHTSIFIYFYLYKSEGSELNSKRASWRSKYILSSDSQQYSFGILFHPKQLYHIFIVVSMKFYISGGFYMKCMHGIYRINPALVGGIAALFIELIITMLLPR